MGTNSVLINVISAGASSVPCTPWLPYWPDPPSILEFRSNTKMYGDISMNFNNTRKQAFQAMLVMGAALICLFSNSIVMAGEPQPIIVADLFDDLQRRLEKNARDVINNSATSDTRRVEQPVADQPISPKQSPGQVETTPPHTVQSKAPSKEAAIGQALPPLPFIERDKEGDFYAGKWRILKPFPLYAKEGGGTIIKTLPKGMKIDGLSLAVHTLSYAVAELKKPLTCQFDNFTNQGRETFKIPLQRGDKIAYLSDFGEGECRVWVKGRVYLSNCFGGGMERTPADDELERHSHYSGMTKTTHWALVRTPDGLKGWLWIKDADFQSIQGIGRHGEAVGE
jgi:hypothetical protein